MDSLFIQTSSFTPPTFFVFIYTAHISPPKRKILHETLLMLRVSVHYARSFAIVQAQMVPKLMSVMWNSGVSAVEGFLNVLKSMEIWSGIQ